MNLQQLGYFVAVARSRSFTRAAETCFVAQPALSQQIRKLEEELGLPVFERRRRGVDLTLAGTAFLEYAEQVLKLVEESRQRISDLQSVRQGSISVMCLPTVATYWLPPIISRYRGQYPEIDVRIHEHAGCTPEDFSRGVWDVGIVQLPESHERAAPDTRTERLFVDEQLLVVPAGHRLAGAAGTIAPAVPLREAAGEAFILPKPACGMSRTISQAFSDAGFVPRVCLETSQIEAVCEMVSAGLGVGLMPAMASGRRNAGVRWRRLKNPVPRRTIALAWDSARSLSPAAAAFVAIVREAAGAHAQGRARSRGTGKLRAVA
ncbi:MAG TPA: LysR family transcriptional regulator [Usitatibacter sp.]|nr:LysR family transcriptional regulator [Usitatibacter sp.]